ncbi:hypothetical protein SSX86_026042 [Deinandra increscens subsp. villosa]|uniref:SANTA domain-containing protein n=1 Tax=Deinandra increscens subsp. villosa TaxID=3103831 RepID=A0AAP0CHF2_9ASTR
MASPSHFQKTVTLVDWWLTKPQPETIGVAGLASHKGTAARAFFSAPILKIYDLFQLETVDGVCVMLQAFINRVRTLENGFLPEVFDHFLIGFPHNWKIFSTSCPKSDSAAEKCVTTAQEDVSEGHVHGDFHGDPQNDDSYTVHTGVKDCKDLLMLSDKRTITPLNPPSVEIPQDHITEAGNEVLCEKSPVTPGFEDDLSLETSNTVESSTRCIARSSKKMDSSKNGFVLVNDEGARKKNRGRPKSTSSRGKKEHIIEAGSEVFCEKTPETQLLTWSDMKSRSNKKKNRVNVPQKALMTRSKSKTKAVGKLKPVTSPKSTSLRGKKGSEGSANILSLESVSGKKSRSGRVILPPLEFWRNQKVVYDEDGQMCGVQGPN